MEQKQTIEETIKQEARQEFFDNIINVVLTDIRYNSDEEQRHMARMVEAQDKKTKTIQFGKMRKHQAKRLALTFIQVKIVEMTRKLYNFPTLQTPMEKEKSEQGANE